MRYIRKLKSGGPGTQIDLGYKRNRQIFSDMEEEKLKNYIKHASSIYFGLSLMAVRKLAFECALLYKIKIPTSWIDNLTTNLQDVIGFHTSCGDIWIYL